MGRRGTVGALPAYLSHLQTTMRKKTTRRYLPHLPIFPSNFRIAFVASRKKSWEKCGRALMVPEPGPRQAMLWAVGMPGGFIQTYFISSGSSLSSFVGVILIPLFLARGQPDRLCLKREERPVWEAGPRARDAPAPVSFPLHFAHCFDLSRFAASHHQKSGEKKKKIYIFEGDGQ